MSITPITAAYAKQVYKGRIDMQFPVKGSYIDSKTQKTTYSQPQDTVELSTSEPTDFSGGKLRSIKEKIASGFYNSSEVAEDISDKLTKFFDEATE